MKHLATILALMTGCAAALGGDGSCVDVADEVGDCVFRRTDPGNDGVIRSGTLTPDIVSMSVCAWEAFDPANDPYTGQGVDADDADLFRVDVVIAGLVNPAGRIGGAGADAFAFGPTPLVGYLDIDVDHPDSGGELGSAAETRFLANVARFGRRPEGSWGERAAVGAADLDNDFDTLPQYERSGADFALVLCGCTDPVVVSKFGDSDGTFEAGETWIVRARLFERAQGYAEASAAFGGSAPGLYDPSVNVRFSHNSLSGQTTVTIVWALDMEGAAALAGQPEQGIDLNVANHTSMEEALQDIIDGADAGGLSGPAWTLVQRWQGQDADDALDPSAWRISGLFGVPYESASEGLYVWTDTSSDEEEHGDCDGDGFAVNADETLVRGAVYAEDGAGDDGDASKNGVWVLENPGFNFSLYDLDGDMRVTNTDIGELRKLGDFDWSGVVNTQDFIAFLNAWVAKTPRADFDLNQKVDTIDFVGFLNAWVSG